MLPNNKNPIRHCLIDVDGYDIVELYIIWIYRNIDSFGYCCLINPLLNNRILIITKLKEFADDKLNVAEMTISVFDRVKKHCGKRRKCWLPAFSPFTTVFSTAFFLRVVKSWDCVVKG